MCTDAWVAGQKVAKRMIGLALGVGADVKCIGMATSHPYAVRALENLTSRKCSAAVTESIARDVIACDASGVPYLAAATLRVTRHSLWTIQ